MMKKDDKCIISGYINGYPKTNTKLLKSKSARKSTNFISVFLPFILLICGILLSVDFGTESVRGNYSIYPSTPFVVYGYVYYTNGTPVSNALVNVTNARTGEWITNYTTSDGYYQIDLANLPSGYQDGDTIYINASKNGLFGSNNTIANSSSGSAQVDIYLQSSVVEINFPFTILIFVSTGLIFKGMEVMRNGK